MISMHSDRYQALEASIEVTPKYSIGTPELFCLFPSGTRVYITDLDTDSVQIRVEAAKRLISYGYVPVPHIAARRCQTEKTLEAELKLLSGAGVRDMLLIGGDRERPAGAFASSIDLLATGLFEEYGICEIGVAGHPEGSPNFSSETALQALRYKADYGKRTGAHIRIVSQFCFDPDTVISWARELWAQGIHLPIHVGIAGPAKLTTLIKYAAACGVGNSLQFFRKHARSLVTLTANQSPENIVLPIERNATGDLHSNIRQLHIFTFGGPKSAAKWLKNRGSWNKS